MSLINKYGYTEIINNPDSSHQKYPGNKHHGLIVKALIWLIEGNN